MRHRAPLWTLGLLAAATLALHFAPRHSQAQAPAKKLTAPEVRAMLLKLGYKPSGAPSTAISIKEGDWTFNFAVGVAQNGETIWIQALLADVADERRVPGIKWLKLMQQNDAMGNPSFSFEPKKKQVWLNCVLINRDVSEAQLGAAIKSLAQRVKETRPLWDQPW